MDSGFAWRFAMDTDQEVRRSPRSSTNPDQTLVSCISLYTVIAGVATRCSCTMVEWCSLGVPGPRHVLSSPTCSLQVQHTHLLSVSSDSSVLAEYREMSSTSH
ncbi:hypothetical protein Pmani_017707 [Petrolisthes manimaculis]|uniref:Uncharacterized protein n=1 Tax=Petrolisthes manimaculis TaxID=1843537 RepID=A0AAE1PP75_9EUCA|nr:hypothetical protein Pmani_017707 [Petrolisthes manimaculis]